MKKITLESFKAYTELTIDFNSKNFLLYGDNGSGKSSIYDAFRIKFFEHNFLRNINILSGDTREQKIEKKREYFSSYNNRLLNNDFNISINDNVFDINDYSVAMINLESTFVDNYIYLNDLLKNIDFNLPSNYLDSYKVIRKKINNILKSFSEDIRIVIDKNDDYSICITDKSKNIKREKDIKKYFNEAKLNLVILSILFAIIEIFQDESKKRVLILDDFITSLDMSNRTFLMKYILESFEEFQIVIFTHNVYFYNLIMYLVNDIYKQKDKWHYANLYEIGNEHKLYMNNNLIELPKLRKKIYGQNPDYQTIGNQLRQKFERLLYEFSKILMIGGVEESNKILEILDKSKNIYLVRDDSIDIKKKEQVYKNSNDLVLEIEELIINNSTVDDIKSKIIEYKEIDNLLPDILKIIRELKLYQKVSMHSLSHGQLGQNPISQKEIEKSLELLEVFQKHIQFLVNKKVDGA